MVEITNSTVLSQRRRDGNDNSYTEQLAYTEAQFALMYGLQCYFEWFKNNPNTDPPYPTFESFLTVLNNISNPVVNRFVDYCNIANTKTSAVLAGMTAIGNLMRGSTTGNYATSTQYFREAE